MYIVKHPIERGKYVMQGTYKTFEEAYRSLEAKYLTTVTDKDEGEVLAMSCSDGVFRLGDLLRYKDEVLNDWERDGKLTYKITRFNAHDLQAFIVPVGDETAEEKIVKLWWMEKAVA